MESLRDVKRKMERELAKGKITPLKLEKMEIFENDYKEISTYEQFKNVLNWLLRLSEYKTGEATVLNNIYMNPVRGNNEFVRTRTAIERMQIFHKIERLVMGEAGSLGYTGSGDCKMLFLFTRGMA